MLTVLTLCGALALSMGGLATFPAVLPSVRAEWGLSNTAAGWITGSFHAGYMALVPLLAALSDRIDARRMLVVSAAVGAMAAGAFAVLAEGLWSALACQVAGGAALAGIYMPGLKGLADRIDGPRQGRYVAFYTTSFTVGTSLSFVIAGLATRAFGWRAAFAAAAIGQALAGLLVASFLAPAAAPPVRVATATPPVHGPASLAARVRRRFAPVLQSRETMRFIWGYAAHMWELFALRAWMVPFLAFSLSRQAGGSAWSAPALAAIVTILGVPASIAGQEVASRIGARRLVARVMLTALVLSLFVGWTATWSIWLALAACAAYNVAISADSAPLTAAALAAAPPGYRGAAMAVHSTIGFTAATLGTLAVGATLDVLGGDTPIAWGVAFAVMGISGVAGFARMRAVIR